MFLELRTYRPAEGLLPDLVRRFQERVPALFARHGIALCGKWLTDGCKQHLVYLTAHHDLAKRQHNWAAFRSDPEWQQVRCNGNAGSEMLQGYDLQLIKSGSNTSHAATPAACARAG